MAGGGDSAYYGLDAATGAQVWRSPLAAGFNGFPWASPLIAGSRVYLGVSSRCDNPSVRGAVRAVDLATGIGALDAAAASRIQHLGLRFKRMLWKPRAG